MKRGYDQGGGGARREGGLCTSQALRLDADGDRYGYGNRYDV